MKNSRTSVLASGAALALGLVMALPAFAADSTSIVVSPSGVMTTSCVSLTHNFSMGARDISTGGDVSKLQSFLASKGYLSSSSVIGVFGPLTRTAAIRYQKSEGLNAQGYVGPLTRARITTESCGGVTITQTPVLTSLSPSQGPTGTVVTLTGTGFTDNNTVHIAFGGIRNIAATTNGTSLTFAMPSSLGPLCAVGQPCPYFARLLTPGDYSISVETVNGTTSPMTFTVTGNSTLPIDTATTTPANDDITVSKVVVPDTLVARTGGTWTVYLALPKTVSTTLHYLADWGDKTTSTAQNILASGRGDATATTTTTIAVFSHVYQNPGEFTPTFTIRDDAGHTVRVVSGITIAQNNNQI